MMRAEPHGRIDRLDVPDTLIERIDRLVDHRQQDAVHDERREIFRHRDGLAKLGDKSFACLERRVVGCDASDKLDELHQRHRIHEMNPDEAFRPVG
jgi:hypothetical protein